MAATGDLTTRSGHLGSFYGTVVAADRRGNGPEPVSVVIGRADHGVTRLAALLTRPGHAVVALPELPSADDIEAGSARLDRAPRAAPVHLHVTDGLLGAEPAAALRSLIRGRPLALTLHDIPMPAEGEPRFSRRSAAYRELCAAADLVIVCSEHERRAIGALGIDASGVRVVPHPIDPPRVAAWPEGRVSVGVLGWIHPGKGHEIVLRAMAESLPGATLVALGAPSPHHAALPAQLAHLASELGLRFEVTGPLTDDALLRAAATVRVPICSHLHVSASGTLGTWMTAGRAPLAFDGAYVREVAERCPGAVAEVLRDDLPAALAQVADDPSTTVLSPDVWVGPSTEQAAARQADVLDAWMRR